uniref:Uncharacterized protein n=1 Tax=Oryza meridionalis TaxID=40149 RepID=A0A0E0D305_9ORYZ
MTRRRRLQRHAATHAPSWIEGGGGGFVFRSPWLYALRRGSIHGEGDSGGGSITPTSSTRIRSERILDQNFWF